MDQTLWVRLCGSDFVDIQANFGCQCLYMLLSILGKKFSRQHKIVSFVFVLFFFSENRL